MIPQQWHPIKLPLFNIFVIAQTTIKEAPDDMKAESNCFEWWNFIEDLRDRATFVLYIPPTDSKIVICGPRIQWETSWRVTFFLLLLKWLTLYWNKYIFIFYTISFDYCTFVVIIVIVLILFYLLITNRILNG